MHLRRRYKMNCANCGSKLEEGSKLCSKCGAAAISGLKSEEAGKRIEINIADISREKTKTARRKKSTLIIAITCLAIVIISIISIKSMLNSRYESNQNVYIYQDQEEITEAEENISVPQLKAEGMIGTWELVNEPYNITFTKDNLFAIHYFDELGKEIGYLYAGKWEIADGDKLVLHATEKGGLNNKFQEIWNYMDSSINLEFTYLSKNDDSVYSLAGSSNAPDKYLEFLNIKKMLTEEEFKEKTDNELKATLENLYRKEGNYGIEILSSTWKRGDVRFAQGECNVRITDLTNNISEEMNVNAWYKLQRMQNLGNIYSLRIYRKSSSNYESALIYSYNNLKGMSQRTDKKLLLPKE